MTPEQKQRLEHLWIRVTFESKDAIKAALDRIAELESAIETHRRDVWGEGPVGHESDVALYSVLAK